MNKNNNIFNNNKEIKNNNDINNSDKKYQNDSNNINLFKLKKKIKSNSLSNKKIAKNSLLNNFFDKFNTINKEINLEKLLKYAKVDKNIVKKIHNENNERYYCLNCKKIFNINEEKISHKNCSIIPIKENYTKLEVFNLINLFENELNEKNKKLELNPKELIKETIISEKSFELSNIDDISLSGKEKPENKEETIIEMTIFNELSKAENEIELIDSIEILNQEKPENKVQITENMTIINKINKAENEIQLLDSIEILNKEKPDNEIEYINSILIEGEYKEELSEQTMDQMTILQNYNSLTGGENKSYKITTFNFSINEIGSIPKNINKQLKIQKSIKISILGNKSNKYFPNDENNENKCIKALNEIKKRMETFEINQNSLNEIIKLNNELKIKDEKIKELRSFLPFEMSKGEKILSVIFSSSDQKIHFSIITKNTEIFANLVSKLLIEYPDYKDRQIYFMSNGIVMNSYKTLEENKIKNSDIILLQTMDNSTILNPEISNNI